MVELTDQRGTLLAEVARNEEAWQELKAQERIELATKATATDQAPPPPPPSPPAGGALVAPSHISGATCSKAAMASQMPMGAQVMLNSTMQHQRGYMIHAEGQQGK